MSGSYRFLSLQTGRAIKRSRWNEKPITDAVIEQVHALANAEANAPLEDDLFAYEWAPNVPILNIDRPAPPHPEVPAEGADDTDEEDETETDEDETDYDSEEDSEEEEEDPEEEEDEYDESEEEEEMSNDDSEDESEEEIIFDPDDGRDDPLFDSYEEEGAHDEEEGAHDEEEGAPDEEEGAPDEEEGAPYGVRDQMVEQVETVERPESTDLLAPLQSPLQTATWATDEPDPMDHGGMPTRIRNRLRSSLSDRYLRRERTSDRALRRARRDRIQKGRGSKVEEVEGELVEAIIKEFDQLDKKKAFKPRRFQSLSVKERRDALRSITLVSEKRSGHIKGRTVADGRPQRKYKAPEDVHSPTVSTEGLMTSLAIDAKEH
eukprot:scaffold11143_cov110-Cylindrotheca_fusiformis.AAC.1